MANLIITVEFLGGLQDLFGKKKCHEVNLPQKHKWTLGDLIPWLKDNLLTEKPEMFVQDNSVRPGILVAVNEVDWELLDTNQYVLSSNDKILFISTLHGG